MNFLCPSCRTPLPREQTQGVVACTQCHVEVDLTRVETAPGQARLWPEVELSGETLGGYALLARLGSGGMGTVYRAQAPDGRSVALKVLSPLLAAEPTLRERFRREARALAKVNHPHVVRLLADGEERGFCWYAMELVTGEDLRARLSRGPLSQAEVQLLAQQLLAALGAVHAAGLVHRDVKPANVLLCERGAVLCDFGIARADTGTTLTESAALLGSLRYMAPEQRWGQADARSDLYSLGVLLHEALALGVPDERPLPRGTRRALTRAIARLTRVAASQRPSTAAEAMRLFEPPRRPAVVAGALAGVMALTAASFWATQPRPAPLEAQTSVAADAGLVAGVDAEQLPSVEVVRDAGEPAVDEVAPGFIDFSFERVAAVRIDDVTQTRLPQTPVELPGGEHAVAYACRDATGALRWRETSLVNVEPQLRTQLNFSCPPDPAPVKAVPLTSSAGVGAKGVSKKSKGKKGP